jgi:hypothetical protein
MSDRTLNLIFGYLPGLDNLNPRASKCALNQRFAAAMQTYRSEKAEMYFDCELFVALLTLVSQSVPHNEVRLCMDKEGHEMLSSIEELSKRYSEVEDEERQPMYWAEMTCGKQVVCYLETEWYVLVGGPVPYHDSYTLSVYLGEYERWQVQKKLFELCRELEVQINEIRVGQQIAQVSWWNRLQHRLGVCS